MAETTKLALECTYTIKQEWTSCKCAGNGAVCPISGLLFHPQMIPSKALSSHLANALSAIINDIGTSRSTY